MATAITPLANITLSSSAATITFSSISGSYQDLMLVIAPKLSATDSIYFQINNDATAANYPYVLMAGNGSTTASTTGSSYAGILPTVRYATPTADNAYTATMHFMDYSATDKHKTVLSRGGTPNANAGVEAIAQRWASTSAITQIKAYCFSGESFVAGTTMALYGVSA